MTRASIANGPLAKNATQTKEDLKHYGSKFQLVRNLLETGTPLRHIADITGLTYPAVHQYAFVYKKNKEERGN